jgi:CHAT domain-containing protein/tetratricopeptide (TPR) repeat protein
VRRWAAFLIVSSAWGQNALEQAQTLERQGKLVPAQRLYESLLPRLGGAQRGAALNALSVIGSALGEYGRAIERARQAIEACRAARDTPCEARAVNNAGVAQLYLGDYDAALASFEAALELHRRTGDAEHEALRLNNIGNVYYFQGRYLEALDEYHRALALAGRRAGDAWSAHARQVSLTNLATLYQKLGQYERALELYLELRRSAHSLSASEQARLLTNLGTVYRRLGDPFKALDAYRAAQGLAIDEQRHDIQIGLLKNIGIVQALDLRVFPAARAAFAAALQLARQSANRQEEAQAHLYMGELADRAGDAAEARREFAAALDGAAALAAPEEQWKALYGLGRLAARAGDADEARERFEQARAAIESLRARLRGSSLTPEFLADKRDVYDALVALELDRPAPSAANVFALLERARARTFQDQFRELLETRLAAGHPREVFALREMRARLTRSWQGEEEYLAAERRLQSLAPAVLAEPALLAEVRRRLDGATALLAFWQGRDQGAVVWATARAAGVRRTRAAPAEIAWLRAALSRPGRDWRGPSEGLGDTLLSGLPPLADPAVRRLLIVPDGALELIPFETLGRTPLVERYDISYLPSAALLEARPGRSGWAAPWRRELIAFGDPVAPRIAPGEESWPRLPASAREVRAIAAVVNGRAEVYTGAEARKSRLLEGRAAGVPLVHFSTHAAIDPDNPERSRIVFSPEPGASGYDYLFLRGIQSLDLRGAELVTLSACETGAGKAVRAEGVLSFHRAFLLAGASATVSSLWKVGDEAAAEFMRQFYSRLATGQTKAEALRGAKLAFLHSGSPLADASYWAAFVLTGDGRRAAPQPLAWSTLLALCAAAALIAGAVLLSTRRTRADVRRRQATRV